MGSVIMPTLMDNAFLRPRDLLFPPRRLASVDRQSEEMCSQMSYVGYIVSFAEGLERNARVMLVWE